MKSPQALTIHDVAKLAGVSAMTVSRAINTPARIPVVETWDLTPTPIDMLVGFSHERIGEAVCAFLHARGRRRPDGFVRMARPLGLGDHIPTVPAGRGWWTCWPRIPGWMRSSAAPTCWPWAC